MRLSKPSFHIGLPIVQLCDTHDLPFSSGLVPCNDRIYSSKMESFSEEEVNASGIDALAVTDFLTLPQNFGYKNDRKYNNSF